MTQPIIQVRHTISRKLITVEASDLMDAWDRNAIDVAREPLISGGTYEEQARLRELIKKRWDELHQLWEKMDESEKRSLEIAEKHFRGNGNQWIRGFELERIILKEEPRILGINRRLRKIREKGGLERSYDPEGRVLYRLPQERLVKREEITV